MLGKKVALRRKELNISQAELAKAVGVSRMSVSKWEKSKAQIKGENLQPLAKALDCDVDWLLDNDQSSEHAATLQIGKQAADLAPDSAVVLDLYDIEVSAGHAELIAQSGRGDFITFNREYLNAWLGVNTRNVFLMPVRGDSMEPTLKNKSIIMINRTEEFIGDGVYAIRFHGKVMIRRLLFSKTGLTVTSDNRDYKEWEMTHDELNTEDFEIIGEVVWSAQKI